MGDKILRDAVRMYGAPAQLDQFIEELAELIVAINHLRRGRADIEHVLQEMVDVDIMMEQMKIILNVKDDYFDMIKARKINKLVEKMANDTYDSKGK